MSIVQRGRIFWYLVKSYLFSVRVYSSVRWSSQFLRGARNHGHVDLPGCTVYTVQWCNIPIWCGSRSRIRTLWRKIMINLKLSFTFILRNYHPFFISSKRYVYMWNLESYAATDFIKRSKVFALFGPLSFFLGPPDYFYFHQKDLIRLFWLYIM